MQDTMDHKIYLGDYFQSYSDKQINLQFSQKLCTQGQIKYHVKFYDSKEFFGFKSDF